jgi:hypothetical protein
MEELSYALITMLEALRLEVRAASARYHSREQQADQLEALAESHAHDALHAGRFLLERKES